MTIRTTATPATDLATCPDCGTVLRRTSLADHLWRQHGKRVVRSSRVPLTLTQRRDRQAKVIAGMPEGSRKQTARRTLLRLAYVGRGERV